MSIDLAPTEEHAQAMIWTSDTDLWLVAARLDGELTLYHFDVEGNELRGWSSPVAASLTVHTYIAQDSAGLLWVGAGYALVAFDPAKEVFVFGERLPLDDEDAIPNALSKDIPVPGTWITGLAPSGRGGISLIRHNVLAEFSAGVNGVRRGPRLTHAPEMLMTLPDGAPVALAREKDFAILSASGGTPVATAERYSVVAPATCRPALAFVAGTLVTTAEGNSQAVRSRLHTSPLDLGVASPDGGRAAFALRDAGQILTLDCERQQVAELKLPTTSNEGFFGGINVDGTPAATPGDSAPQILSVAINNAGAVAIGDDRMHVWIWK
ncbi:MAG: hypothetical protein ACR2HN_01520 [Tepidiformaceae bacterium]